MSSKNVLYLLFALLSFKVQSQNNTEIQKMYAYSFDGNLPAENVQLFEQRLSQLPFVKTAKVRYKTAAQKGELIIETTEPQKSAEGDKGFDLIELKKLIQSFNLNPNELKIIQN
jgi:hypothetical protein